MFHAFVTHERVPNFRRGDIVVIDNLSAHTNATVRQLIHNAGCEVLFTPPYAPEFNLIEEAWAKLKDFIRRQKIRTRQPQRSGLGSPGHS